MSNSGAEGFGRRIKQPWRTMNQLRGLDWARVRHRVQCRLKCSSTEETPVVHLCADENGMLQLANEDAAHEWLVASLINGKLNGTLASNCLSHNSNPRAHGDVASSLGNRESDSSRQLTVVDKQSRDFLSGPTVVHDHDKWLEGTIDAQSVRLMHGRKCPTWPKVLQYSMLLEQQVASGSCEGPPPVQISRHAIDGDWVGHDGGHRLYAALLSGLPLCCKWKPDQLNLKMKDS